MKKIIITISMLILLFTNNSFADNEAKIYFSMETKNKTSSYILVNIKNVKNLYAASVDFSYNPKDIKVKLIEGGDMIKNNKSPIIELGGETEKEGNIASYQFTFTGKVNGLSGSGNICKIEIEHLNDNKIEINNNTMKIKLAGMDTNFEVKEINYSLVKASIQKGEDEAFIKEENLSSEKVDPVIGTIGKDKYNSNSNNSNNDSKIEVNKEDEELLETQTDENKNNENQNSEEKSEISTNTIIDSKSNFNYLTIVIGLVLIFGVVFLLNKKKNN